MEDYNKLAKGSISDQSTSLSRRLFLNKEILTTTGSEKHLPRQKLINKLNYLNFTDGVIAVIFRHRQGNHDILIQAHPQPCVGADLTCHLVFSDTDSDLADYQPLFLMIDDGLGNLIAPIQSSSLHKQTLTVTLPEECLIKTQRSAKRHLCRDIACDILLDDVKHSGALIDFTPGALGIRLTDHQNEPPLNHPETAHIHLSQNNLKLFSGSCRLIRSSLNAQDRKVVYQPIENGIHLFPQRQTRNPRRQIAPSFSISFQHPLSSERVLRDIFDVSTSGFSIREPFAEQTLMVGMIIPELFIHYAGVVNMKCSAQVVYRRENQENNMVQSGLAITDIDVLSFSRLNHLVGAHLDAGAHVSTTVDMDALWEFFFDTGFIYGEKYQHLYPYRDSFKETYRKLYQDNPDIARHFTYEKNGKIYGHIAMVHAYNPSWVIHHFSAKPLESKVPGMLILRQIMHFINGCHRFHSFGMNYVMTYYRPDNQLVDRIFGGFTRELNNPEGSSLDLFSYLHFDRSSPGQPLPEGFTLRQCVTDDLKVFKAFYEQKSGGLLFNAFRPDLPMEALEDKFLQSGFKRNYRTYCLCREDKHLAFFMVNQSDLGLNLSDLLNGIKIFVVDENTVKWPMIHFVLQTLGHVYTTDHIPILVYPADYLAKQGIDVKKQYQLWIMTGDPYSELYTDYMRRKFRIKYEEASKQ